MRDAHKSLAALAATAFVLMVASTAAHAVTPCERQQRWENTLEYIDTISASCQILTTAARLRAGYIPYPSIAEALNGGLAGTLVKYAAAYGFDLKKVYLDKHHICRIIRAGRALSAQANKGVRQSILHYGLCPPTLDACKARVKAAIFQRYGLTNACAET